MLVALFAALLAIPPRGHEGDAQAFTALTDAAGAPLADARYSQWITGTLLHIEARSDFPDGRVVVERATLRLHPDLEQQSWDWTERKGSELLRSYSVDFGTKKAVAFRADQQKRWKEDVEVDPGKTFAGIGFVVAIKALRPQVQKGQQVKLRAIAMTPRPRSVQVIVTRNGPSTVQMAGRTIEGDEYTIHPDVPAIAKLFVKAPDQHVWLIAQDPPAFLRFEGPLVEPDDPVVHIDLIPAGRAHPQARRPEAARR